MHPEMTTTLRRGGALRTPGLKEEKEPGQARAEVDTGQGLDSGSTLGGPTYWTAG